MNQLYCSPVRSQERLVRAPPLPARKLSDLAPSHQTSLGAILHYSQNPLYTAHDILQKWSVYSLGHTCSVFPSGVSTGDHVLLVFPSPGPSRVQQAPSIEMHFQSERALKYVELLVSTRSYSVFLFYSINIFYIVSIFPPIPSCYSIRFTVSRKPSPSLLPNRWFTNLFGPTSWSVENMWTHTFTQRGTVNVCINSTHLFINCIDVLLDWHFMYTHSHKKKWEIKRKG